MRWLRSPNFSSRHNTAVTMLVLHYTGMKSATAAKERLCDAEAKVSAHYLLDEDGTTCQLVEEAECAWHAGVSFWRGHRNVNDISIGIEIVNPGHEWGYRAFPAAQMEALAELSAAVLSRHAIPARNVVAHSDVAPERKDDPGELFDWAWLAGRGVGLWPEGQLQVAGCGLQATCNMQHATILQMQKDLATYGYNVPQNGMFDEATRKVVVAFQRHFRPSGIGGRWDSECQATLAALLAMV